MDLGNYIATVIVTSDTCFKEPKKDVSGDYVVNSLKSFKFQRVDKQIVPDDRGTILEVVKAAAQEDKNLLIITVGGTGLCPRDVTPEATGGLYEKNCWPIASALVLEGLKHSPHAALSRLTAGIYSQCLIVNFPGKPKACVECFGCLSRILVHGLEQVAGNLIAVDSTHKAQQVALSGSISMPTSPRTIKSLNSCIQVPAKLFDGLTAIPTPPISPPPRSKKLSSPNIAVDAQPSGDSVPASISLPDLKPLKISSQYPLIEYEKALDIMGSLAYTVCQDEVLVKLDSNAAAQSILGDILSETVHSEVCLPPYPVSTMDGFVVNIPQPLNEVVNEIGMIEALLTKDIEEFKKMQQDPEHNFSFFCYQVNTGGQVPEKSFAVVPVERTAKIAQDTITIAKIETDRFVRKPGSDLCEADSLKAGTLIGPAELSILLSMGCKEVKVVKRPTISLISTGDELIDFYKYDKNSEARVINSNGPLLTALYTNRGFSVVDIGTAEDNPRDILLKIHTGLKKSDILIITGGASMGSKDHVKDVVEQIGGIVHFGRVNIKPGKPAALASLMLGGKRKFIFCLPGNPVSAYITSLVLVLPFLEHGIRNHLGCDVPLTMDAIGDLINVEITTILDSDDMYIFDGRLEFARARLSKRPNKSHLAIVSTKQQSSRLLNLKDCDCLILIDPSKKGSKFLVGQTYPALRLRN